MPFWCDPMNFQSGRFIILPLPLPHMKLNMCTYMHVPTYIRICNVIVLLDHISGTHTYLATYYVYTNIHNLLSVHCCDNS